MNELLVPLKAILIEVGPRDGFQSLPHPIPTSLKIETIKGLIEAGISNIQITSFVNPARVPQFKDAEEVVRALGDYRKDIILTGLVLNRKGLERAFDSGIGGVEISLSASDEFSRKNARMTYRDALAQTSEMVVEAKERGLYVRGSIQCSFGTLEDKRPPLTQIHEILDVFLKEGIDEVVLADTASVAGPLEVKDVLKEVMKRIPLDRLTLHFHGERSLAMVNLYTALLMGVYRFDTCFGGIGGCPFMDNFRQNICTEEALDLFLRLNIATGIEKSMVEHCTQVFNKTLASLT